MTVTKCPVLSPRIALAVIITSALFVMFSVMGTLAFLVSRCI